MNPDEKLQANLERLRKQHRELDEQIIVLEQRHHRSSTEDAEIKRLKLLKLRKKEEIDAIAGQ